MQSWYSRIGWFLGLVVLLPAGVVGITVLLVQIIPKMYWVIPVVLLNVLIGWLVWRQFAKFRSGNVVTPREIKLMASQEKFVTLYERSPVPYVTLDESGAILTANLATVRLFQSATDTIVGTPLLSRITVIDENEATVVSGKLVAGVPILDIEAEIQTDSGEQRYVLMSVYTYGATKEKLVSLVDITHQKIVDMAKSEFVALATHQLRTPVAAIRWNVELLRKSIGTEPSESEDKYLVKIERNVLRMIALINDFLSVSKLETGTFATSFEEIKLSEFCNAIYDEFAQTVTEKQIQFNLEYVPQEALFTSDTRLLHILVSNLVSNAVKYVGTSATITLRYELTDTSLQLTVSDTGIGIPAPELEKLFTKFYRASNAQSHRAEGTGLGLYIVKQSVEKLGGTIEVESVENEGTTFTVQLPTTQ